ncbi:MAG: DUF2344 domain-containing protein [Chloroflexi bacterium]|nr:DUF2344 domain-containing protein [Chloroflexota bacterium]
MSTKIQRLRITFACGDAVRYITHLDLMRAWERALRRAAVPVAYSEGFSPHAQISIAAPLPVGTTSDAELMDVFMAERVAPRALIAALTPELPAGLEVRSVQEVGIALPALQADVRWADYDVDVVAPFAVAGERVERFLAADTWPWEHKRDDETRSYDIRAQVSTIDAQPLAEGATRLRMRLRNDNTGSGRPEQVALAMELPAPVRIHRTALVLAGTSPVREAWRRAGRVEA